MAGLLQAQQAPQGAETQAAPQAQQAEQGPQQGARPSQVMYERIMDMMLRFLYSDQGVQSVQEGLQLPGDPIQNISNIVARLVQKLWYDSREQGKALPPMLIMQATVELSQAVTDMAVAAGVVDQGQADEAAKQSFYGAMELVGQQTTTEPQERQQFQQLLQQLAQMDDERMAPQQPQGGAA